MGNYKTRVRKASAVRYGDENGNWQTDSVAKIAAFLLELPDGQTPTDVESLMVLEPVGSWNPPTKADLQYRSSVNNPWVALPLGYWIVRDENGVVVALPNEIFERTFEKNI